MGTPDREAIISAEELDFISALVHSQEENKAPIKDKDVRVSIGDMGFFQHFAKADNLGVVAQFGDHRFVFPIEYDSDEFGKPCLLFAPPQIFEQGTYDRSWRLFPNQTLQLVDRHGDVLPFRIRDISASGLSIEAKGSGVDIPDDLDDVFLKIPGQSKIPIYGRARRVINKTTVAFELAELGQKDNRILRDYLYRVHQIMFKAKRLIPKFQDTE